MAGGDVAPLPPLEEGRDRSGDALGNPRPWGNCMSSWVELRVKSASSLDLSDCESQ